MSSNEFTFRLFKEVPSFIGGFTAMMDLSSVQSKYKYNKNGAEADCESIKADWHAVGKDMSGAISEYATESRK